MDFTKPLYFILSVKHSELSEMWFLGRWRGGPHFAHFRKTINPLFFKLCALQVTFRFKNIVFSHCRLWHKPVGNHTLENKQLLPNYELAHVRTPETLLMFLFLFSSICAFQTKGEAAQMLKSTNLSFLFYHTVVKISLFILHFFILFIYHICDYQKTKQQ